MRLYYFVHSTKGGESQIEVFASAMKAKRRLSELRVQAAIITKDFQNWIISGKRGQRPADPITLPSGIEQVTVDAKGKEGIMEVFRRGMMIGRRMKNER